MRGRRDGDEEEHEALLQNQQEQQQIEDGLRTDFKGLKWTRVISMEGWETATIRAWDIGADIIFELLQMTEIDTDEL